MPFRKGNQEWRKANHKGHAPTMLRPHTDEEKAKISASMRKWYDSNSSAMRGRKHSEETRQKMSEARRGKRNANWKGGLTELIKGIRRSTEYYHWRKVVLERDNHTCQDCGSKDSVNAHHIQSVIDYPEQIFNINNGLSLCEHCHKRHTAWQRLKGRRKIKSTKRKLNGSKTLMVARASPGTLSPAA